MVLQGVAPQSLPLAGGQAGVPTASPSPAPQMIATTASPQQQQLLLAYQQQQQQRRALSNLANTAGGPAGMPTQVVVRNAAGVVQATYTTNRVALASAQPGVQVAQGQGGEAATPQPTPTPPPLACSEEPDALGTSRVLTVGTLGGGSVGLKSYPRTLPLADHEVVLTFDDGPWPGTTPRVLAALKQECVQATFFLIGRNAVANPDIARAIERAGHTIGYHSMTHPNLSRMSLPKAMDNIDRGFAAVDSVIFGEAQADPHTPFFRFPGFFDSAGDGLVFTSACIGVFGTDMWASDWNPMTPQEQLHLILSRLERRGRGIILFHDIHWQTANMLPDFLLELKARGYRVVAIVPGPGPMETVDK